MKGYNNVETLRRKSSSFSRRKGGCWFPPGLMEGFTVSDSIPNSPAGLPTSSETPGKPRTPFLPLPREVGPHRVDEQPKGTQMPPGSASQTWQWSPPPQSSTQLCHFSAVLRMSCLWWEAMVQEAWQIWLKGVNCISPNLCP